MKVPDFKDTALPAKVISAPTPPPPKMSPIVDSDKRKSAPSGRSTDGNPFDFQAKDHESVDEDDFDGAPEARSRSLRRSDRAGRREPHRGTAILVMGILALLAFWPVGPIAWIWANEDLRKMANGRMDTEGRGNTECGRILGMIATVLALVGLSFVFLWMFCVCGAIASVPGQRVR